MNSTPRRRWFKFSLRTLLIVMVLSSAAFGYWVHWSREWIRQRHELLRDQPPLHEPINITGQFDPLPFTLRLFDEKSETVVLWRHDSPYGKADAQWLFPEARIIEIK
jgi:hypothetical protein